MPTKQYDPGWVVPCGHQEYVAVDLAPDGDEECMGCFYDRHPEKDPSHARHNGDG